MEIFYPNYMNAHHYWPGDTWIWMDETVTAYVDFLHSTVEIFQI